MDIGHSAQPKDYYLILTRRGFVSLSSSVFSPVYSFTGTIYQMPLLLASALWRADYPRDRGISFASMPFTIILS